MTVTRRTALSELPTSYLRANGLFEGSLVMPADLLERAMCARAVAV
jgi:hypothetical protein